MRMNNIIYFVVQMQDFKIFNFKLKYKFLEHLQFKEI